MKATLAVWPLEMGPYFGMGHGLASIEGLFTLIGQLGESMIFSDFQ